MDEDENLRVHAEVCHVPISADRGVGFLSGFSHVPISADRGVGFLSGFSLKCPQFLTNASCLSGMSYLSGVSYF